MESDKDRWNRLQAQYRAVRDQRDTADIEMRVKYHTDSNRWKMYALKREVQRVEKLERACERIAEKLCAMWTRLGKRNWSSGVPAHWIYTSLTFEDMVRPLSEPLSVVPPLAFGATQPMR